MSEFNLDYRYFRAFLTTAKYLNFSKAAGVLNIAQSAVSRQIKLLEDSLDQQLIIRSSKKVILTEKGQSLVHLLTKFENDVKGVFLGEHYKTLRVGILHGLLESWFNQVIHEYTKNSSNQLVVEINAMEKLKEKLINGSFDLVFTTENIQNDIVSSLKLFDEKMVLISLKEINPKEPWDYPWILYNENDNFMHLYKKHSKQIISVNSITAIVSLVKKGAGIAIVPDHLLKGHSELKIYELKGLPKTTVYLSTLNYQTLPVPMKTLIEIIKKSHY